MNKDETVQALLELRQAQKTSFGSSYKSIESEIQKIKQSAQINYQSQSENGYMKWAAWYFPPIAVQTIFLILWLATLIYFYKIFKLRKFNYKYLFIFVLTILLASFLIFTYKERKLDFAIIKHDTQLKLCPDRNYISRKNLKVLDEVEIINKVGDWYKVKADSIIGWIENTDLELVNNNEI